jgi:hypothetical protein
MKRFKEFNNNIVSQMKNPDIRYGQAVFNAIELIDPEFANTIRGTEHDCYYDDEKVSVVVNLLGTRWVNSY